MTGLRQRMAALAAVAVIGMLPSFASADPWKDESGHGRWEDGGWRGGECRGLGCDDYEDADYGDYGRDRLGGLEGLIRCNRALIGGALGGAAGGVLGSRVGEDDLRRAATIGGAVVGALLGGAIGRSMDRRDKPASAMRSSTATARSRSGGATRRASSTRLCRAVRTGSMMAGTAGSTSCSPAKGNG